MTDIVLIRQTDLISDADIARALPALQTQLDRDFRPYWGMTAKLWDGAFFPTAAYPFYLQDGLDDPNALGYHVDEQGKVSARIDVRATIESGGDVWSVVSHEILETVADPLTSRMAPPPNQQYIIEVCDPVEETGYVIGGITVSNFVTPAYFGWNRDSRLDHNRQLTAPVPAMLPGGYLMSLENGQWVSRSARRRDGTLSWMATRPSGRSAWRARTIP